MTGLSYVMGRAVRRMGWLGILGPGLFLFGCFGVAIPRRAVAPVAIVFRGDHLQVACHFECGRLGPEALRVGEAAWERVADLLGIGRASSPLGLARPSLHLYGSLEDYQAAEARVGRGRFRDVGGFSSRDEREAHVLVPGDLPGAFLQSVGLPLHYRRNVAHEAAHLATYDLARGAYWPPWLAEGMAGWVERQTVARPAGAAPMEQDNPWASTHLWRAQRLMANGALPTVTELLTGAPLQLSLGDAYAVWTELFDFLLDDPFGPATLTLVRAVAAERIPEAVAWPAVAEIASGIFGEEGFGAADGAFRAHLLAGRPLWVEAFRSLELSPNRPDVWLQHAVADLPSGALAWRAIGIDGSRGIRVDGTALPLGDGPWELRVSLGRVEGYPLLIALGSDGEVRVLELDPERPERLRERSSRRLRSAPSPSADLRLSVRFTSNEIVVAVDGAPGEVTLPIRASEPDGAWGVGVAPGTAVAWRDLRASPPDGRRPGSR